MKPSQGDSVGAQETGRHQGVGLAGDELAPTRPGAVWGGFVSGISQDLPDGGCGDAVPETAHLTVGTPVAPCRLLSVVPQH